MNYKQLDAQTLATLRHFDDLPGSAYARRPVLQALFDGISDTEVDRRVRDGRLPKPVKLGSRVNYWQIGELREALARLQSEPSWPVAASPNRAPPKREPAPPPHVQPPARVPDQGRRRHAPPEPAR
jgi:predicted DNA-binding transcriptional regulator AlpA